MITDQVRFILDQALRKLAWPIPSKYLVWVVKDRQKFDISSNLAMVIASQRQMQATAVAQQIIAEIDLSQQKLVEVVFFNGYLNFRFQTAFLNQIISDILQQPNQFGRVNLGHNRSVNYEWISANPTGYLHLGHARNAILGMAISNLLEFVHFRVYREFYINDRGKQVFNLGKSVYYAYCRLLNQPIQHTDQEIYANPEIDTVAQLFIDKVGKKYLNSDFSNNSIVQEAFIDFGKRFFLAKIQALCLKLEIRFDKWFYESSLFTPVLKKRFLDKLVKQQIIYQKDGATWLQLDKQRFVDDYVLVKKTNEATYFFGDLMYHANKFDRQFDFCIDLWGADHHGHYKKIQKALAVLGYPADNYIVNLLQMVKIVKGGAAVKMSKRAGTSFYFHDLYNLVGDDFLKFIMLSFRRTNQFVFDLARTKQQNERNTLKYLQYAHARACQIIQKNSALAQQTAKTYHLLTTPTARRLILNLHDFPNVIQKAALSYEPFGLIEYVLVLCRSFNAFYENNRIQGQADSALSLQLIGLVQAFQHVFKTIFKICQISTPEKM